MFSSGTNFNFRFNPQYKPPNYAQSYLHQPDQNLAENIRLNVTRPLSNSNSIRSHIGASKSKYSLVKTNGVRSPKKNLYKWENRELKSRLSKLPSVSEIRRVRSTSSNPLSVDNGYRKITLVNIVENVVKNHHRSSTPFYSLISKGWFSVPPCGISCINSNCFDLRSCCFINKQFLPVNTLSLHSHEKCIPSSKIENQESNNENLPTFVKLSKHKLVRQPQQSAPLKIHPPAVLCTKRKLIRQSVPEVKNQIALTSETTKKQEVSNSKNAFNIAPAEVHSPPVKRKRLSSSSLLFLTKRKLVRTPRNDTKKSVISDSPAKLIRVGRNKLIRSSLLKNNAKKSYQNYSYSQSVLSQMIKYRRRPYPGSSYVLLTRNKLIRNVRFKNKVWKKNADDRPSKPVPKKKAAFCKIFVSVGKNKLIRKSLFSKTNKISGQKKSVSTVSPLKSKLLSQILKFPSQRVQRFTNHLARMKLKYFADQSTFFSRNRFTNKCKNNKRVLRRKNSVCPIFRRKGECHKKNNNNCWFIHDKKYIVNCRNYMKGACENENCLLSHDLIPQKVPLCLHFLNGNCESDNCPFLHVKLDPNAPICAQFLRGYCEAADKCTSWHLYACPQFKNAGKCDKGDGCRLPHRGKEYFEGKWLDSGDVDDENVITWRYFEKNKLDGKDLSGLQIIPERQALGILPDYIPFRPNDSLP